MVYPKLFPIIRVIRGLLITSKMLKNIENKVVIISELVTLYLVSASIELVLLCAVILDIVRGMLAPTRVMITIYIESVRLYMPSSVVDIILVK